VPGHRNLAAAGRWRLVLVRGERARRRTQQIPHCVRSGSSHCILPDRATAPEHPSPAAAAAAGDGDTDAAGTDTAAAMAASDKRLRAVLLAHPSPHVQSWADAVGRYNAAVLPDTAPCLRTPDPGLGDGRLRMRPLSARYKPAVTGPYIYPKIKGPFSIFILVVWVDQGPFSIFFLVVAKGCKPAVSPPFQKKTANLDHCARFVSRCRLNRLLFVCSESGAASSAAPAAILAPAPAFFVVGIQ